MAPGPSGHSGRTNYKGNAVGLVLCHSMDFSLPLEVGMDSQTRKQPCRIHLAKVTPASVFPQLRLSVCGREAVSTTCSLTSGPAMENFTQRVGSAQPQRLHLL
jgi:hypothetical protein